MMVSKCKLFQQAILESQSLEREGYSSRIAIDWTYYLYRKMLHKRNGFTMEVIADARTGKLTLRKNGKVVKETQIFG